MSGGSLGRRMEVLEARSRAQAAARVKEAWDALTDREVALNVVLLRGVVSLTPAQEREAKAAQARLRASITDGLLDLAIAPHEARTEEALNARVRELVEGAVLAGGRRARLSQLVGEIEG
ncbi:MAG: hypothetical protein ACRDTR_03180 [Rubrobacter sp.]